MGWVGFEVVSTLLGPEETGSHHRFWGVGLFHVFVKGARGLGGVVEGGCPLVGGGLIMGCTNC